MTIALYLVESTGILTELDRVKLSGNISGKGGAISWAGNSLAIITGELNESYAQIYKLLIVVEQVR